MWESIRDVLVSSNAIAVLISIIVLILIVAFLAKKGIFQLNVHGVQVGGNEDERAVIRQQTEWSELFIQSMRHLPMLSAYDNYHTLYVLEKVFDEVLSWIVFNHISDSENYISIKQEKVWNLIQTLVTEQDLLTEEFRDVIYENTSKMIKRLVCIRKNYHK